MRCAKLTEALSGVPRHGLPNDGGAGASPSPPTAPWHSLRADEVVRRLATSPGAISHAEAEERLRRHGPNVLQIAPPTPWFRILGAQFRSVVVLLLVLAAGLAVVTGDAEGAAAIVKKANGRRRGPRARPSAPGGVRAPGRARARRRSTIAARVGDRARGEPPSGRGRTGTQVGDDSTSVSASADTRRNATWRLTDRARPD